MARKPAVAGAFYEGDALALRETIEGLIAPDLGPRFEHPYGIIAPHAAYHYSGPVAGSVYSRIPVPDRVVIIAPNHTGLGSPASVGLEGPWLTPLGEVGVDAGFGERLIEVCPDLEADELAHMEEHAIEVQLPFIQVLNPHARIVPVCLRTMSYDLCACLADTLAGQIDGDGVATLVVASSDMNHNEPRRVAMRKDRMAIERIEALDAKGLYDVVVNHHVTMCGFVPSTVMLLAARALGARAAEVTSYGTSGDVNHDDSSVVGYVGVVVADPVAQSRPKSFAGLR